MKKLSAFLNYSFLPKEGKLKWTKSELMQYLMNNVADEMIGVDGKLKYDGLIVCISCHGDTDCIVTSDGELISRTDVHRSVSVKHHQIREVPRIFLFDACSGTGNRLTTGNKDTKKGAMSVDDA